MVETAISTTAVVPITVLASTIQSVTEHSHHLHSNNGRRARGITINFNPVLSNDLGGINIGNGVSFDRSQSQVLNKTYTTSGNTSSGEYNNTDTGEDNSSQGSGSTPSVDETQHNDTDYDDYDQYDYSDEDGAGITINFNPSLSNSIGGISLAHPIPDELVTVEQPVNDQFTSDDDYLRLKLIQKVIFGWSFQVKILLFFILNQRLDVCGRPK